MPLCKLKGIFSSHLTSIYILAAKVVPVEEHELDPVALVQSHEADQQQQDGSQTSGQLHRVHELCWCEERQRHLKLTGKETEIITDESKADHRLITDRVFVRGLVPPLVPEHFALRLQIYLHFPESHKLNVFWTIFGLESYCIY